MTEQQLGEFATMIAQPVSVARRIVEQEEKDEAAHDGREVRSGYDYDRQVWCGCDYCLVLPSGR